MVGRHKVLVDVCLDFTSELLFCWIDYRQSTVKYYLDY